MPTVEHVLDWIFWPIGAVERWGANTPDGTSLPPSSLGHLAALGGLSVVLLGAVAIFGAVLLYAISLAVRGWIEDVLRHSCRGCSIEQISQTATTYVWFDAVLLRIGSSTGVVTGSTPPTSPGVNEAPPSLRVRATRWLVRRSLALPRGLGALIKFLWAVPRTPVFVYCVLGAWWIVFHPGMPGALGQLPHSVSSIAGAAASALFVAVLAVVFDHGISPKIRARNAFRHERLVKGEELLRQLTVATYPLLAALHTAAEDVAHAAEPVLEDSLEKASRDRFRVEDGRVVVAPEPANRRPAGYPTAWIGRPPRRVRGFSNPVQDRSRLKCAADTVRDLVADTNKRGAMLDAAPRSARRYIREVHNYGHAPHAIVPLPGDHVQQLASSVEAAVQRDLAWKVRVIEVGGTRYLTWDHRTELSDEETLHNATRWTLRHAVAAAGTRGTQDEVDAYFSRVHDELWELLVLEAYATRFLEAVGRHQYPTSLWGRLQQRLSG